MGNPNIITSDDILGKDIVDAQGEVLGVIQKLHIEKKSKQIVGVTVDQGFMKPDLFIGLEYIDQFGVDTVFLNTYPKNKIKGMTVINDAGKKVGVVTGLEFAAANKLKSIIVKGGVLTGPSIVSVAHIREIGEKVILKPEIQIKEEQVEEEPPKETF